VIVNWIVANNVQARASFKKCQRRSLSTLGF
jgi:hypothetical protein